jgi:hypothetical protein
MSEVQALTLCTGTSTNRDAVHAELEKTRLAFHALLRSTPTTAWKLKIRGTPWQVGELLAHIVSLFECVPALLDRTPRKRVHPGSCLEHRHRIDFLRLRRKVRRGNHLELARRYERAHAAILATVESLQASEWEREIPIRGKPCSVAEVLSLPLRHFEEHTPQIRTALRRQRRFLTTLLEGA